MSFESELVGGIRDLVNRLINQELEQQGEIRGESPRMRTMTKEGGPWPWIGTGSGPNPWQNHSPAVALFVSGAALKQVASKLPDGPARKDLLSAAQQSIADWEDDYCGTPPRPLPSIELAGALAVFANNLGEGTLRTLVLEEAGQLAQKGLGVSTAAKAVAAGKR
jgi:hypothetical protein